MASIDVGDPEILAPGPATKASLAEIERLSHDEPDDDLEKRNIEQSDRVDREVAQYAAGARIVISPERSTELRRKIDKRVLSIMITTYFLQAVDKGTLSFASIMGLNEDTGMVNKDGSPSQEVRMMEQYAKMITAN